MGRCVGSKKYILIVGRAEAIEAARGETHHLAWLGGRWAINPTKG